MGVYQGSLQQKEQHIKAFMANVGRANGYKVDKLAKVLNAVVSVCAEVATQLRDAEP